MIIKQLSGHSGCKIFLHEKNNDKFVRKTSFSVPYNERLKKQARKQIDFKSCDIKVPKVLSTGVKDGLYFFDMEYIGGTTFNNYISSNTIQGSDNIMDKLLNFVDVDQGINEKNDMTDMIYKKLHDVDVSNNFMCGFDIKIYKDYCANFDWTSINTGTRPCHGDLTFENIIIYKSEIYLIDFLDSFIDTKYIDFSKLLQDVMLMWSWRNCPRPPLIKNIYMYDKIMSRLNHGEKETVQRLLVLNLLRILPYANDVSYVLVRNSLNFLEEKFKI